MALKTVNLCHFMQKTPRGAQMSKKSRMLRLSRHYQEYVALLSAGLSHNEAIEKFQYLHPVILANLLDIITKTGPTATNAS